MLKTLLSTAAAAALALAALPAAALTNGPTPNEQVGMHIGTTATNGSAVIVTDQNGTHPEGYPGMATINRTSAAGDATPRHHHHKHHPAPEPTPG